MITTKTAATNASEATKKAVEEVKKDATEAKKTATKAVKKAKKEVVETSFVQFSGKSLDTVDIIANCKAAFKAESKRKTIEDIKVYINVDDSRAYYVVNDDFSGSIEI